MEFENEWWLRKCAKVVLKHNFLLQNGKIFQYSGEAHFLVKRHGCCFIFAKSKNWNFWALTNQPLVQMLSNFVCVTIFGFHCHLKNKVFGLMARTLELMEWLEIMIWKLILSICQGNFHPQKSVFNSWQLLVHIQNLQIEKQFLYNAVYIFTRIWTSPEN